MLRMLDFFSQRSDVWGTNPRPNYVIYQGVRYNKVAEELPRDMAEEKAAELRLRGLLAVVQRTKRGRPSPGHKQRYLYTVYANNPMAIRKRQRRVRYVEEGVL